MHTRLCQTGHSVGVGKYILRGRWATKKSCQEWARDAKAASRVSSWRKLWCQPAQIGRAGCVSSHTFVWCSSQQFNVILMASIATHTYIIVKEAQQNAEPNTLSEHGLCVMCATCHQSCASRVSSWRKGGANMFSDVFQFEERCVLKWLWQPGDAFGIELENQQVCLEIERFVLNLNWKPKG